MVTTRSRTVASDIRTKIGDYSGNEPSLTAAVESDTPDTSFEVYKQAYASHDTPVDIVEQDARPVHHALDTPIMDDEQHSAAYNGRYAPNDYAAEDDYQAMVELAENERIPGVRKRRKKEMPTSMKHWSQRNGPLNRMFTKQRKRESVAAQAPLSQDDTLLHPDNRAIANASIGENFMDADAGPPRYDGAQEAVFEPPHAVASFDERFSTAEAERTRIAAADIQQDTWRGAAVDVGTPIHRSAGLTNTGSCPVLPVQPSHTSNLRQETRTRPLHASSAHTFHDEIDEDPITGLPRYLTTLLTHREANPIPFADPLRRIGRDTEIVSLDQLKRVRHEQLRQRATPPFAHRPDQYRARTIDLGHDNGDSTAPEVQRVTQKLLQQIHHAGVSGSRAFVPTMRSAAEGDMPVIPSTFRQQTAPSRVTEATNEDSERAPMDSDLPIIRRRLRAEQNEALRMPTPSYPPHYNHRQSPIRSPEPKRIAKPVSSKPPAYDVTVPSDRRQLQRIKRKRDESLDTSPIRNSNKSVRFDVTPERKAARREGSRRSNIPIQAAYAARARGGAIAAPTDLDCMGYEGDYPSNDRYAAMDGWSTTQAIDNLGRVLSGKFMTKANNDTDKAAPAYRSFMPKYEPRILESTQTFRLPMKQASSNHTNTDRDQSSYQRRPEQGSSRQKYTKPNSSEFMPVGKKARITLFRPEPLEQQQHVIDKDKLKDALGQVSASLPELAPVVEVPAPVREAVR